MAFHVEDRIEASVDVVWRHLSEPALMAHWMAGIDDLRSEDGGPLRAGSQIVFTSRGRERTSEVVELDPERTLVLRSTQGPVTATYRYACRPDGPATHVSLDARCVARGPAKLMAPLIGWLMRRADGGHLTLLKLSVASDAA